MPADILMRIPIRRISVVIDTTDPLVPEVTLRDFRHLFGKEPEEGRYRIVNIEVITSPDDQQPMLVSECAKYSKFLRRESDSVLFQMRP